MAFKFVKELIIKSDDLISAMLRFLPGGNLGKQTTLRTTQTDDRTIDLPDASGVISLRTNTEELENKIIDADKNVISNLEVDNFKSGVIVTNLNTPNNTTIPTTKAVNDKIVDTTGPIQSEIDAIKAHQNALVQTVTLIPVDISGKQISVNVDVWKIVYVKIDDGPVLVPGKDITVISTGTIVTLNWNGYWIDGLLASGDSMHIVYYPPI